MAIAQTVQHFLEQNSVEYELVTHPHSGSSHETADAAHVREDHIAKAVMVRDGADFAMIVVPAVNWVEIEHLRKELDREIHLATENDFAKLFSDCETGAVPPLGPAYGIETFLDEAIMSLVNVYFESGDHEHLVSVAGKDYLKLLGGARHGFYSHKN